MKNFIVVNDASLWPELVPGAEIVEAEAYLTDPIYAGAGATRIYNLCDSYRYQRLGYYVSLLAEARGHKPIPRARTIEDLQSPNLVRLLTETLEELVQHAFRNDSVESIEWDFYFGLRPGHTEDVLGQQLFQLLKAPLLRAHFERCDNRWQIRSARAVAMGELDAAAVARVSTAAQQHFLARSGRGNKLSSPRYEIAILHDPDETHPPSNLRALQKFAEAADRLGVWHGIQIWQSYGVSN